MIGAALGALGVLYSLISVVPSAAECERSRDGCPVPVCATKTSVTNNIKALIQKASENDDDFSACSDVIINNKCGIICLLRAGFGICVEARSLSWECGNYCSSYICDRKTLIVPRVNSSCFDSSAPFFRGGVADFIS